MADTDFTAFIAGLDSAWREERFDDLKRYLAEDVVFASSDGAHRLEGRDAAIDS